MTYESFELVELGSAEVAIEVILDDDTEELDRKFNSAVAPYVEFDE
jgi:hypothetical protein